MEPEEKEIQLLVSETLDWLPVVVFFARRVVRLD